MESLLDLIWNPEDDIEPLLDDPPMRNNCMVCLCGSKDDSGVGGCFLSFSLSPCKE